MLRRLLPWIMIALAVIACRLSADPAEPHTSVTSHLAAVRLAR